MAWLFVCCLVVFVWWCLFVCLFVVRVCAVNTLAGWTGGGGPSRHRSLTVHAPRVAGQGVSLMPGHHPSFCRHTHIEGQWCRSSMWWQTRVGVVQPCCPAHACLSAHTSNGLGRRPCASRLVCMQRHTQPLACEWPCCLLLWWLCSPLLFRLVDDQVQARELSFCVVCARSGCSFEACVSAAWWWVAPVRAVCCSRGGKAVCVHESAQAVLLFELNSWWVCSCCVVRCCRGQGCGAPRFYQRVVWCAMCEHLSCVPGLQEQARALQQSTRWLVCWRSVCGIPALAFGRPRCGPGFLPLACWVSCSCNPTARQQHMHPAVRCVCLSSPHQPRHHSQPCPGLQRMFPCACEVHKHPFPHCSV